MTLIRSGCRAALAALAIGLAIGVPALQAEPRYFWPRANEDVAGTLIDRIAPPEAFERVPAAEGSFAEWLHYLPLRPPHTPVRLYDGRLKWSQDKHVAVVAIDTGVRNLQQCADAIMRLRAEYLLSSGRAREIAFNFTNGRRVSYRGRPDDRKAFQRYLTRLFAYAGSYSLEREMRPISLDEMQTGDVFIEGGFPGHAVLVADMASNPQTGERRFLLLQSYMPAQDIHILTNPKSTDGAPWYSFPDSDGELVTPEWLFKPHSLRRFRE